MYLKQASSFELDEAILENKTELEAEAEEVRSELKNLEHKINTVKKREVNITDALADLKRRSEERGAKLQETVNRLLTPGKEIFVPGKDAK